MKFPEQGVDDMTFFCTDRDKHHQFLLTHLGTALLLRSNHPETMVGLAHAVQIPTTWPKAKKQADKKEQ